MLFLRLKEYGFDEDSIADALEDNENNEQAALLQLIEGSL